MKNIKELGLKIIELENQVLLVDENKPRVYGDYYVLKNSWGLNKHEVTKWTEAKHSIFSGKKSKPTGVIIASTKLLEGLPLLMIEDEIIGKPLDEYIRTKANQDQCIGFIEGYNKAKEVFRFTEEDLRKGYTKGGKDMHDKCISHNWRGVYQSLDIDKFSKLRHKFIQSLTKKELYVEVELFQIKSSDKTGYTVEKLITKITNNQIKSIWK